MFVTLSFIFTGIRLKDHKYLFFLIITLNKQIQKFCIYKIPEYSLEFPQIFMLCLFVIMFYIFSQYPCSVMLYSHPQHHNDTIIKQTQGQRRRKEERRKKTSLEKNSPLTLLQGFERVVQSLHVRGCSRPNINFIFWPHCYDRHVVSFLFSWFWGPLHRGFRGPLVGCGLPYHI